ncbi:mannose-6-phosphate isomerase, class I [Algivirga pacifica]|uniref:mannose-6-phosphate isomerase n=1 Tax=Algivirga pacifica TaxID=1162670 RepID=A0ABP9DLQ6_9BACT
MRTIEKLQGVVQHYAWGGTHYIPDLLGIEMEVGTPYAEYWMGAHPKAPSLIGEENKRLDQLIQSEPNNALGKEITSKFGRLPYLFKVLDVKDMLSIQVHPTKEEAEKGFKRENEMGIELTAPNRNYKDDNHKPEVMVALGEFWLLHGFLPEPQLRERLEEEAVLNPLLPLFEEEGYKGVYQKVMELSQKEVNEWLKPLVERIVPPYRKGELSKYSPDYWAAKAVETMCDGENYDRGIFSIYLFNIMKVEEGEAVFQDAGIPHAYLEGQNMELMANSDNVLRGGLTPKHVDVSELLKHVTFKGITPNVMKGNVLEGNSEKVYPCPVPDFQLSRVDSQEERSYSTTSGTMEILFVHQGNITAKAEDNELELKAGEAFVVKAGVSYTVTGEGVLYKATAPVQA